MHACPDLTRFCDCPSDMYKGARYLAEELFVQFTADVKALCVGGR